MNGDVHRVYTCALELGNELALLIGIETNIAADTEHQVFLVGAAREGFGMRIRADLFEDVELLPNIEDAEIGVGVESGDKLVSLMEHVGFERALDLVP